MDELLPRLVLGDKARQDLATFMSWFASRLKKLNADFTETGLRIGDLESRFHAKAKLAEPESSILERTDSPPTSNGDHPVGATAKAGAGVVLIEANPAKTGGGNAAVFEPAAGKDSSQPRRPACHVTAAT